MITAEMVTGRRNIMVVQYKDTRFDREKWQSVTVADWIFGENLERDKIIIGRSEPDSDDYTFRLFKVEECSDYVYDLKKTKIKAIDGVTGLVEFMRRAIKENLMTTNVEIILNHAWKNMKYEAIE